jgi:thioredoxin reductase
MWQLALVIARRNGTDWVLSRCGPAAFSTPTVNAMHGPSSYDAIVVGAGPAGLSAALVLGRCLRHVLVFDHSRFRNERSLALHCYLGHDGLAPHRLLELGRAQLEPYDTVELRHATVTEASGSDGQFHILASDGSGVTARKLIVATGMVDEPPAVPGLADLFGRSVHVCPYCDAWEYRGAGIAVYGEQEKGAELATLLTQWSDDIVLCTGGHQLSGSLRAVLEQRGVTVIETPLHRLDGAEGKLRHIVFKDGTALARAALFFTTGQHPRSPLLHALGCSFDERGGVVVDQEGETSVAGVYAVGDVSRDVQLAIIAAAEGARAAIGVNKALCRAQVGRGTSD